jgi:hypothetical protein
VNSKGADLVLSGDITAPRKKTSCPKQIERITIYGLIGKLNSPESMRTSPLQVTPRFSCVR